MWDGAGRTPHPAYLSALHSFGPYSSFLARSPLMRPHPPWLGSSLPASGHPPHPPTQPQQVPNWAPASSLGTPPIARLPVVILRPQPNLSTLLTKAPALPSSPSPANSQHSLWAQHTLPGPPCSVLLPRALQDRPGPCSQDLALHLL